MTLQDNVQTKTFIYSCSNFVFLIVICVISDSACGQKEALAIN